MNVRRCAIGTARGLWLLQISVAEYITERHKIYSPVYTSSVDGRTHGATKMEDEIRCLLIYYKDESFSTESYKKSNNAIDVLKYRHREKPTFV